MSITKYLRAQWDRLLAGGFAGLGLLVLLLGWLGVSGTPYATEQVPYVLSGGVLAVLLLGIGGTLWVSADLRDEWRKLDQLDETLLSLRDLAAEQVAPAASVPGSRPDEPSDELPSAAAERPRPRRRARQEPVA
jgi:hypothetical protein